MAQAFCQSLIGSYFLYGEALPGMPTYFRFKNLKLSMDTMLGLDLSSEQKGKVMRVEFIERNRMLELLFHGDQGVISTKLLVEGADKVNCQRDVMTIKRVKEGKGEAVTGTTFATHMLFLEEKGSLVIETQIESTSHSMFFRYSNPKEKYGARFRKIE